jgi:hypothetical protein
MNESIEVMIIASLSILQTFNLYIASRLSVQLDEVRHNLREHELDRRIHKDG